MFWLVLMFTLLLTDLITRSGVDGGIFAPVPSPISRQSRRTRRYIEPVRKAFGVFFICRCFGY